jgi:MinD superfamily P-loop ATPase/acyl-coenzyme A thioesterase PaaI-like protein
MVATSLAYSLAAITTEQPPLFLDCDVEAPNAHLFLHPRLDVQQGVELFIPSVDETQCTHCGKCAEICQYHAIAVLGQKTLVFPQLCHGCGICAALCPEKAITEVPNQIGVVERGPAAAGIAFGQGMLDVGEPMAVPIIRHLKKWAAPRAGQVVIRDAPPGTSCPVVETVRDSDYLLLVTEPTPFGLHDLRLAAQVADALGIPAGVIVNRENGPCPELEQFCGEHDLPILLRIPFERAIAEGVAQGKTLVDIHPEYGEHLRQMFSQISTVMSQQYNSSSCFACGLENPCGLHLRFFDNGKDRVFSSFTIDPRHAGYPGMAHGGAVAAILDEVGGRTMMIHNPHRFFVTARMDMRFRQPVPVGVPLKAVGWLLKRRASRTQAHAEIYTDSQGVLAEADALYVDLPPDLLDPDEAESQFGWRRYDQK